MPPRGWRMLPGGALNAAGPRRPAGPMGVPLEVVIQRAVVMVEGSIAPLAR